MHSCVKNQTLFNCWKSKVGDGERLVLRFVLIGWEIIASNPERNKPQTLSLSVNIEPSLKPFLKWNFEKNSKFSKIKKTFRRRVEGFVQPIKPYMKPLIRFIIACLSDGMGQKQGPWFEETWNENWTIWFGFWTSVMVKIISKPEIEVIWGWFQIKRCWTGFFKIFKNISMA